MTEVGAEDVILPQGSKVSPENLQRLFAAVESLRDTVSEVYDVPKEDSVYPLVATLVLRMFYGAYQDTMSKSRRKMFKAVIDSLVNPPE